MSTLDIKYKKKLFNKKYMPFIDSQSYINIYYGGAGSGKSVFNAQKTILDMMQGGRNYLVVREVYGTYRE